MLLLTACPESLASWLSLTGRPTPSYANASALVMACSVVNVDVGILVERHIRNLLVLPLPNARNSSVIAALIAAFRQLPKTWRSR